MYLQILISFLALLFLAPTSKLPPAQANLWIHLDHFFGEDSLKLFTPYTTLAQDEVVLSRLQYYLSNFELIPEKGKRVKFKDTYRLVQMKRENSRGRYSIKLEKVPTGTYQGLQMAIGVDARRNHAGEQTGDLDPVLGMFWTWEQGYIFFKCEGYRFQEGKRKGSFIYHLGREETYRQLNFTYSEAFEVRNQGISGIHLRVDVQKLFGNFPGAALDLRYDAPKPPYTSIMGGEAAPQLADNLPYMFSIHANPGP